MTAQTAQVQDAGMATKKEDTGTTLVALRLRNAVLARIDARLEQAGKIGGIKPNRSAMIAFLIEQGLDATEGGRKK